MCRLWRTRATPAYDGLWFWGIAPSPAPVKAKKENLDPDSFLFELWFWFCRIARSFICQNLYFCICCSVLYFHESVFFPDICAFFGICVFLVLPLMDCDLDCAGCSSFSERWREKQGEEAILVAITLFVALVLISDVICWSCECHQMRKKGWWWWYCYGQFYLGRAFLFHFLLVRDVSAAVAFIAFQIHFEISSKGNLGCKQFVKKGNFLLFNGKQAANIAWTTPLFL